MQPSAFEQFDEPDQQEQTTLVNQSATQPKQLSVPQIAIISLIAIIATVGTLIGINSYLNRKSKTSQSIPTPKVVAIATDSPSPLPTDPPTPDPTPTPTPSPTPKPTPTPTPSPSPSPTPSPTPSTTVTLTNMAGQDGYEASDGTGSPSQDIRVGRTPSSTIRGFFGFDISSVPKTSHIVSATLRVYQRSITGDPYSVGQVIIDHLDYGSSIISSTYGGGNVFASNFGNLSTGSQIEWKQIDVTERVKYDLSTHTSTQFRLRLSNETQGGSGAGDYSTFDSANSGYNSNPPQLVISYY